MKKPIKISIVLKLLLQVLVILIIAIPNIGRAQDTSTTLFINQLEKINQLECKINQKLSVETRQLKSASLGLMVLDSVYEVINWGIYVDNCNWYFKYGTNNQLISSENYLYTENGAYRNIAEYRSYNEHQQITDMTRIRTFERENKSDTSITFYSEHNIYSGENLIEEHIFVLSDYFSYDFFTGELYISEADSFSYTNTYQYDNSNKLIYSNEYYFYGSYVSYGNYVESYYYYNELAQLEYTWAPYVIYKYENNTVGDEYVKSEKYTNIEMDNNVELFDTITQWIGITYDAISCDDLGRVKTLKNSIYEEYYYPILRKYKFKAEFEYNTNNQLTHASYYSYANEDDSTTYYESTRIDNTYDADGNRLEYHKTFYDAKYKRWETHTKKTYYYSSLKSIVAVNRQIESHFNIYPNPVSDVLNLLTPASFKGTYSILDVSGKCITTAKPTCSNIDVSQLKPGIYFLKIEDENESEVLKFLKK